MVFLITLVTPLLLVGFMFSPTFVTSRSPKDDGIRHVEVYHKFKNFLTDVQPIIKAVLKDMPPGDSYNKYRQDLEGILKRINDKSAGQLCFDKHFSDLDELVELMKNYRQTDATEEAKAVLKLIVQHGFRKYLSQQWFRLKKIDLPKYKESVEKLDKTDEKYKVFSEKC
uniref:Uncharacterized protein n=1 Tax=Musca domestica TaxID=7370 RepID=A0A1I8NJ56_MUSDO